MNKYFRPLESILQPQNVTMIQAINYNTNLNFFSQAIIQTQTNQKSLQLVRDDLIARIQKLYSIHLE
jgi:hypothetical protein